MRKRFYYLDLLRVFACFAVIVIHVSALNMDLLQIGGSAWQAKNIYDGLARFSVPVFVMISGMFMLEPSKKLTIKQIYKKYVLHMFLIWIVWELFYALVDFWNMKYSIDLQSIRPIISDVLRGHFHLWYLPMLIGLYIVTPILRVLTEKDDKATLQYFIALFFVFTVLRSMLPIFINPGDQFFIDLLTFIDKIPVTVASRYVGYYMLGYYLHKYPLKMQQRYMSYFLAIIGAALTIMISTYYSLKFNDARGKFDFFYIGVFFMSIGIFVFFKETVSKLDIKGLGAKIIASLSSCSFGIYLLHAFIIERIYKLGLMTSSFNPALSIPVIAVLGFLVCWPIVFIYKAALSKIKKSIFKEKFLR